MVETTIEDLDFTSPTSRESGEVRRRGCIEHDIDKGLEIRTFRGTTVKVVEIES
jgi:hypothetical protein